MPPSHTHTHTHIYILKKTKQKEKEKEIFWGGSATPAYFFFFFLDFFKIKYVMVTFWEKKRVKVVELPQFESLGG
jgi:hypothetical protein